MRIVAILLALGTLAERVCRAPLPVRLLVIVLLRPAESVARDFIAGELALPVPAPAGAGYDPASAIDLAERFVALAIALAGIADWFGCRRVRTAPSTAACKSPMAFRYITGLGRHTELFDTS